ncbi:MAG TPA: MauE/DoxX family redox-associated membrane protein [Candidatus Binataceae bacterium]
MESITRMLAIDPAIQYLLAIALAAIFGASGAMKLADVEMFESSVANYLLLPLWMEKPFAWTVPLAECACAAGLLSAATRALAAMGLLLLLGMFSGAIAINLLRGRTNIDCGCFGPALRQGLSARLLVRNVLLMIVAGLVEAPAIARPLEWIDFVTIAMGAATLVVLYASANYAIGNAPRTRVLEMI